VKVNRGREQVGELNKKVLSIETKTLVGHWHN